MIRAALPRDPPAGGLHVRRVLALAASFALVNAASGRVAAQQSQAPPPAGAALLLPETWRDPADANTWIALARRHRDEGRMDQAERALREGMARSREARPVRLELAALLADTERYAEAAAVLEPVAREDVRMREALARLRFNVGARAYQAGRKAEARRAWEEALRDDPDLLDAAVRLGIVLVELEQKDSAAAVVERALLRAPADVRLLGIRAAALEGTEALPAAVAAHRALRAERSGDEAVGLQLVSLLLSAREVAAAAALLDSLVAGPDPSAGAHRAAAELALATGRLADAVETLERAVARYPDDGALWRLLGDAESRRGSWDAAVRAYTNALPYLAAPEEAELPLAAAHLAVGDSAAALDVLTGVGARDAPGSALLAAAARAAELDRAEGEALYALLLARDPAHVEALERIGALAEAAGDTVRAVGFYRRAVATDRFGPASPFGLYRLAPGPPDSARVMLRRALWRGMEAMRALDLDAVASMQAGAEGVNDDGAPGRGTEYANMLRTLRTVLDTAILATAWGPDELASLRLAYPGSGLLDRYHAVLLHHEGRDAEALAVYERILRRSPADAELLALRAEVLVSLGRGDEAADAYRRALDVEPEDEATFRALVALLGDDVPARADLLDQVRRLRLRLPASVPLAEREIELLHRLGRPDEASRVAAERDELRQRKRDDGGEP